MIKIKQTIISIIGIIIIVSVLLVLFVEEDTVTNVIRTENLSNIDNREKINKILINTQSIKLLTENRRMDENIYLKNEKNDSLRLRDAVGEKPKLILYYSDTNCDVCVNNEFRLLKKYKDDIGVENIIILGNYMNSKDILGIKSRYGLNDIKVCNLMYKETGLPAQSVNTPCVFMLNPEMIISHVYVPEKVVLNLSDNYYAVISDIFRQNNQNKYLNN